DVPVAREQVAVRVPLLVELVVGDELDARLDQPPGKEGGLAGLVPAGAVADRVGLPRELDRIAEPAGGDQVVRALPEVVLPVVQLLLERRAEAVELAEEAPAAAH